MVPDEQLNVWGEHECFTTTAFKVFHSELETLSVDLDIGLWSFSVIRLMVYPKIN